jgi:hypothetical protein
MSLTPAPDLPDVTQSQDAEDFAVHRQSFGLVVTVNSPVPPFSGKRPEEAALRATVHGSPFWLTVNVFPPMLTVPFRIKELAFSGMLSANVPLLLENVREERLIQSSFRETSGAEQEDPFAVIRTLIAPPV